MLHVPALTRATVVMANAARSILNETFASRPVEKHISAWYEPWQQNCTSWHRASPSLALEDAIRRREPAGAAPDIPPPAPGTPRKRALVPGCARGYDVLLLACLGYDTFGVDASPSAIAAATTLQQDPAASRKWYAVRDARIGRGEATFIAADFFHDHFLSPKPRVPTLTSSSITLSCAHYRPR